MMYPTVVIIVSLLLATALIMFIVPVFVAMFADFTVGVVWIFGWNLWYNGSIAFPSVAAIPGVIYIGLVEMSLTFVLWGRGLKASPRAARVANLIYLSPPISLFLIHWLAGEPIYPSTIVAWPLVLSGVFLSQSRRQVEN